MTVSSRPDPYILRSNDWRKTAGLKRRSPVIDANLRTVVLPVDGQSQWTNINPTTFASTAPWATDQFNVWDGELYEINGAVLGCSAAPALGLGNPAVRVASGLLAGNYCDRVIVGDIAIGGTLIAQHGDPGGIHYDRFPILMDRLAKKGIVPGMDGVAFVPILGIGESDNLAGTSQSDYEDSQNRYIARVRSTGITGPMCVVQETMINGLTSSAVRAAQANAWLQTNVFRGTDMDAYGLSYRQSGDQCHLLDNGATAVAADVVASIAASGALVF